MNEAQAQVREHRLERASREWLVDRIEALEAERDALREAAQALVDARTTGAKVEPWGALIAALERHQ